MILSILQSYVSHFYAVLMTGDILQRINDHSYIKRILATSSLNDLFSMTDLFIFGLVPAHYSFLIFGMSLIDNIPYLERIIAFLKKYRYLYYILYESPRAELKSMLKSK